MIGRSAWLTAHPTVFRAMTGMHPDEYVLPGLTIDLEVYRTTEPYRREA